MSFKHLLLRIKELSCRKASCRLSLPRRQIHSKWLVVFTHWFNNPFENLLRDWDILLRLILFFCLLPFERILLYYPLQLEGDVFKQHRREKKRKQMHTHRHFLKSVWYYVVQDRGSLITQTAACFSDVLIESEARTRRGRPGSHMDGSPSRLFPPPLKSFSLP